MTRLADQTFHPFAQLVLILYYDKANILHGCHNLDQKVAAMLLTDRKL